MVEHVGHGRWPEPDFLLLSKIPRTLACVITKYLCIYFEFYKLRYSLSVKVSTCDQSVLPISVDAFGSSGTTGRMRLKGTKTSTLNSTRIGCDNTLAITIW